MQMQENNNNEKLLSSFSLIFLKPDPLKVSQKLLIISENAFASYY